MRKSYQKPELLAESYAPSVVMLDSDVDIDMGEVDEQFMMSRLRLFGSITSLLALLVAVMLFTVSCKSKEQTNTSGFSSFNQDGSQLESGADGSPSGSQSGTGGTVSGSAFGMQNNSGTFQVGEDVIIDMDEDDVTPASSKTSSTASKTSSASSAGTPGNSGGNAGGTGSNDGWTSDYIIGNIIGKK